MVVDEIPEVERKGLARKVADKILAHLKDGTQYGLHSQSSCSSECILEGATNADSLR